MEPAHNLLYNQVKAGLGLIDPDQISHKINEVSKDTKYYQKQKERSKLIDEQIDDLKLKLQFASKQDLHLARIQVDSFISSLEKKRDLNQIIFHADLDAFFASVEIINDPSLKGIPFAVGGSIKHGVISTSSYEARKFGVRSGMAVFIALSLCPQLRIVNHSGRYAEFSELVQSEFAYYDPNYISFGLDEASLNMTEYLQKTQQAAVDVAREIQEKVYNKTKLTISIGIAPTNQLAKIASDINKPNGIYEVPNDANGMLDFISSLPVRKIPGVGGVTERKLQELNFIQMKDILDRKEEVWYLFSTKFCKFILSSALGIQQSHISHDDRKSISKEETFEATDDLYILIEKVERMSEKLALKLQRDSMKCKTVTVKFKTHNFQNITHTYTFKQETSKISDISGAAVKILMEMHQTKHYKLRLIGVRVSNFLYPGQKVQKSISDWISNSKTSSKMNQLNNSNQEFPTELDEYDQDQSEADEDIERGHFDYSIKSYFKEGYETDDNNDISENLNQVENDESESKKKDPFKYSIKSYFKEGKNKPDFVNFNSHNQSEKIEKDHIDTNSNNSEVNDYSIMKYFQKGCIKDDCNAVKYYGTQLYKNKKIMKKHPTDSTIKKFFNNTNSTINKHLNDSECQLKKNDFLEDTDEEKQNRLDYYFQSQNSIYKSSDYDDDFDSADAKYFRVSRNSPKRQVLQANNQQKKGTNVMKTLIEKYHPESLWESESKKLAQFPTPTLRKSSMKKRKTKAGTRQIGSFFNSITSTPE